MLPHHPHSRPVSGVGMRHTHLLGGLVTIVLLPPELRLHLELDILKVHAPVHRLEVAFGHIVGGALPLLGVQKVGEFLPGEKDKGEPVYNSAVHGRHNREISEQLGPVYVDG